MDEKMEIVENVVDVVEDVNIVDVVQNSKQTLSKGGKTALIAAGVVAAAGITALIVKKLKKKETTTPIDVTPTKEVHDTESIVEDIVE